MVRRFVLNLYVFEMQNEFVDEVGVIDQCFSFEQQK